MTSGATVRCDNLLHVYGEAGSEVAALRGVDLDVASGQLVSLLGPSGSGKTTLLWHLAGLLAPSAGSVEVNGQRPTSMSGGELAAWRRQTVGVVLQNPSRNLLPWDTALGNLLTAQRPRQASRRVKVARGCDLLDSVGIGPLAHRVAGRLSGGEQQRLALAIALVNEPALLLADEPTSQLDAESSAAVVELIRVTSIERGTTVVVVTHDPAVGAALGRTITIRDGRVGSEGRSGNDYLVVGRDGTIALPPELHDVLPPGSLARVTREGEGIALHRVDPEDSHDAR
jgi:ABC-type lipoprotein export system ATPase subunit